MRHLWILRHAKAVQEGRDGDDHSRPLTGRGQRQCVQVASYLADQLSAGAPTPELVLSSSAVRARRTAEAVHGTLGDGVPLDLERGLYGADPDDIVDRLRLVPDETGSVMVVGHNPTLHQLTVLLLSPDDSDGRRIVEDGLPTAAVAHFALDVTSWSDVVMGGGHLEDFFVPTK
ncbi:MAG: SixA phosphatase family protein [Acidimicrobiales bacterium]